MSILIAPERTSLCTVLKRVVLSLFGDNDAFSLDCKEASVGIGGAGTVGGVGVCMNESGTAELDTEAPGTYPRDSLVSPLLVGVSCDSLGATAPVFIGIGGAGTAGVIGNCISDADTAELDAIDLSAIQQNLLLECSPYG